LEETDLKALNIFLILLSVLLVNCGSKTDDEIIDEAIDNANRALSRNDCQTAIDSLEVIGRKNTNSRYLIVLASAYACRAGYNELILFTSDFPKITSTNVLGGLTLFSTSDDMTSPSDTQFADLETAFEILVFAGGLPTSANANSEARRAVFGNAKGGDIDAFIMYISLVQLGRYLRYYGNVDTTTGAKGGGAASHSCLLNYTDVPFDAGLAGISTYLAAVDTGSCTAIDDGSDELGLQGNINVSRACQGVVLLNNLLDVLPAVLDSYSGGELSELDDIRTSIIDDTLKAALLAALGANPEVSSVTSQTLCESQNTTTQDYLEIYFAIMFESLFRPFP